MYTYLFLVVTLRKGKSDHLSKRASLSEQTSRPVPAAVATWRSAPQYTHIYIYVMYTYIYI